MIYRRFGLTGLQMPVFSCGGMRYQHKWQDVPLSEVPAENQRNLEATIRRSVEVGVNHIETARGYGSSERQLGLVLPTFPRDKIIVQTKIPPNPDPAAFAAEFEESLARLRLDHVDLLSMHGINTYEHLDQVTRPGGCLAVARRLQKEGRALHIGFSTHASVDLILRAIEFEDADGRGFDYVNLHWYFIYQRNWPAVQAAARRDMGLFIISPTDKGGMLYKPSPKFARLTAPLHPIIFNDLFCLMRPEIHTLSLGAARPSDFDLHVQALDHLPQAADLVPPIAEKLLEAMHAAVGRDFWERYDEGVPPWEAAPGYMNIKIMLWLWNLIRGWDLEEYASMRYGLLGNGGHWFPGLNAVHSGELDLSKALEKSPFADQIPGMLRDLHAALFKKQQQRLSTS